MLLEVLQHLNAVERVLARPGGNLLLVGRAGVGRRSAVNLCAHLLRLQLFTPQVHRLYDYEAWRRDLKAVLQSAGVEGTPTVTEDRFCSIHDVGHRLALDGGS